ncbi:CpsB/CapC family capsule biosynthesis tyrosine phosphatase [Anaerocolumna cellulosilytica]|uniref:CpsB/CapC family capsule biosynthesis tyrosine phosphatase n=1 Tax=Anaerocolumna cellulosilytica TaxID=433286 RepID=UPI001612632A|nr:CpsB/CapC family capsule biosynthesis tyrosine phosphatase [Anaerocolumna cellulosilytica]MBB5195144.1 protein-tyrosine phosphatase [Anaerocolumna cellulosilytica]
MKRILRKCRKKYIQKNKTGFIDLHCHILPEVDDGAKDLQQAINMLKLAYKEGIRAIAVTPHYKETVFENPTIRLIEKLNQIKVAAKEFEGLTLTLGCEIYYSHESVHMLLDGVIPTIADSRYILVEFSPYAEYKYIKNGLQDMILNGYRPILAHAERYDNLCELEKIRNLTDMGVYLQINTGGVLGEFGREEKRRCKKLLRYRLVHVAATDAHDDTERAPAIKKCFQFIKKKYGTEYAEALFIYNPKKVLAGKYLM